MKTILCRFAYLVLCGVILLSQQSIAVPYYWMAGNDPGANWSTTLNWSTTGFGGPTAGNLPGAADDVLFPTGVTVAFTTAPGAITIQSIALQGSASVGFYSGTILTLQGGASSIVGSGAGQLQFTNSNSLVLNGGTLSVAGNSNALFFNGNLSGVTLNGNAVLTVSVSGGIGTIWDAPINLNGTSTITNNGTISLGSNGGMLNINTVGATVNNSGTGTISLLSASSVREINIVDGTLNNAGTITVDGTMAASRIRMSGNGVYSGSSPTYSGSAAELIYAGAQPTYTVGNEWTPAPSMNGNVIINRVATNVITLPSNRVQFGSVTVQSGILDLGASFIQMSSGAAVFTLQGGATLRTTRANGFNGINSVSGAIQSVAGGTAVYSPTANYILDVTGGAALNLGAQTGLQAITQANNFTVIINGGGVTAQMNSPLTLSGALNVSGTGQLDMLSGASMTLNGGGSQVSSALGLVVRNVTSLTNTGGLTIQSGSVLVVAGNTATITGTPINYVIGSRLQYSMSANRTLPGNTEFPSTMNGDVTLTNGAGNIVTLNGTKTINGALNIVSGTLATGGGNSLTLGFAGANTIAAANGVVNVGSPTVGNSFLTLQTGVTLNNDGQINVFDGSAGVNNVLELQGGALLGGGTTVYSATNTELRYTGAGNITAGQEFPAANGPTNLTLNKTAGTVVTVLANRSLPVTGILTLTSGILDMGGNTLSVNNPTAGAAVVHTVNVGWMVGTLGRAVSAGVGTYSFPVGSSAVEYLGFTITSNVAGAGVVDVIASPSAGGKTSGGALLTPFASQAISVTSTVNLASASLSMNRFSASFTAFSVIAEAPAIGGVYTALPVGGFTANNILTPGLATSLTAAIPKLFAFATIPTTYYYNTGDPTLLTSWGVNPGGTGANPGAFTSGFTFIIESGKTATYNAGFTVPVGVTLQIDPGGTLAINDNNNLTINGTITYINATSKLLYTGGPGATHTTGGEFPAIMPGTVEVNRTAGAANRLDLNSNKTLAGTLTLSSGILWKQNFALTLNGTPSSLNVVGGTLQSDLPPQTVLNANGNLSAGRIILAGSAAPMNLSGFTLVVSGTGVLELNGAMTPQIAAPGQVTFNTGTNLQFTGGWAGTVNTNTLFTTMIGNIDIQNGSVSLSSPTTLNGNLNIVTGGLSANGNTLTLAGAGTITTNGANRITIGGVSSVLALQRPAIDGNWFTGNSVSNLDIAAASTLTNPLTASINLNLTSGIFTTSTTNMLTIGANAIVNGGSPARYINGPARVDFQAPGGPYTKIIPIGRGSSYLPVTLQNVNTLMPPPLFEVEAYNYHCNGTALVRPLGNEHWRVQTIANPGNLSSGQIILGTMSPVVAGAEIAFAGAPGFRDGLYSLLSPAIVTMGVPNTVQVTLPSAPNDFLVITGALPTTFYYQSGAAEILANWDSNLNGGGSQPSNFSSGTFYVPSGRTAPFTAMTLPIFASGTLLQIESGGAITIANGRTLTVNGSIRVNAGGRLTLQGTGTVFAPSGVQYLAPTATLEYNAPANRLTSVTEFPNTMSAQVEIQSGSVRLDASKQLQSSLLLNNSTLTFGAADRLRLSGALTFTGSNFVSDSTDTLIVDGAGSIAGSIGIPALARLTMNRGGLPLTLAGTMQITQQLGLFGGILGVPNGASVVLQSSADTALVGGNSLSFVSGSLVRQLRPNLTPTTMLPIFYPIGRGITYLPLTLTEATTGTVAPQVSAEAFAVGAGGTPALGVPGALSTSEYWRLSAVNGSFTGARVGVLRGGITSMNTLASSLTQTGLYTSVGGSFSNLPQGLSLLSDGVSNSSTRFYSIVGTLQGSPRITGFTPSIGGEGTTMLIRGINFTTVNAVAVGGVPVQSFMRLSDTTISVVLGAVATGPIQVGSPLGGAASDSSFTFVPLPVIGNILPNPAGAGTVITISGANLSGLNTLQIGGVTIPQNAITANPDGSFTVQIPLTATTSTIVLSTPGGTVISTTALTLVSSPVLTSFSPAVSSTGAVLTILGQNFTPGTTVRFGNVFAQAVTVNTNGRLSVVVPPQALPLLASSGDKFGMLTSTVPNAVYLTVRTGGGTVTSATQFVYSPFPNGGSGGGVDPLRLVVLSEARSKIVPVGGRVRVTGANLELIQELTLRTSISSTKASYILSSSAEMTVLIPSTGLLRSTNASLSSSLVTVDALGAFNRTVVADMFTLVAVPIATSVAPSDAAAGEEILVRGENLDLISSASIGGTAAMFRLVNGQLFVRVPSVNVSGVQLPASGILQFTSLGGIVTTAAVVNAALASGQPVIISFSPTTGIGGTVVVVSGVNFTRVTDALVGGVPVGSFVINSSTQMTITLGAQVTSSSQGGITLLSPLGSTVSLQPFIFTSSLAGDIEALERALSLSGLTLRDIAIEQTDNRVTSILAQNRPLNLTLEPFIAAIAPLSELRNLDLSNTGLMGTIPQNLARFTKLERLNLSKNSLTGTLPSELLCSYKNLQILDVSANKLEGLIPVCIATLDKVRTLNLSQNRFTGGIPKELGGMVSLEELLVNNNRLTGGLPPEFGTPNGGTVKRTVRTQSAQTLRVLDVSANELTGSLPAEWGGMSALQQLNVSNNRLSGVLPSSIVNWVSLQVLRLGNNRFVGEIPALSVSQLTTLSLEQNRFTGRLPERLSKSLLKVLTVQGNGLVGLPALPRPARIEILRLDSNALEFGSLEPNLEASALVYSPQDSIGSGGDTVVRVSSRLVIPSGIAGKKTVYQWLRNGRVLAGADAEILVLESAKAFQSGVYVCRATNSLLPELTLFSRSYKLVVTGADQTLDAPELLFPSVQAENIAVRPRLKWSGVEGAEQYELTVGRDAALRDVVLRRTVDALAGSSEQSYRLLANDGALERGGQYFWRVRSLAVGSEGIPSETRSFRVVPLGVDIGLSTVDAGRTLIGTQRTGDGVLVNVGLSAISLDSATAITNTDVFSLANQTRNVVMQANEEVPINVSFTPKVAGEALASVQVWYKDAQQTQRQVRFDNALRGRGGALRVDGVVFPAVRLRRTALQWLRMINVSRDTVVLTGLRLLPTNSSEVSREDVTRFALDAVGVITLLPNDTVNVTVRCTSPKEADVRAQIQVLWNTKGSADSASVSVQAQVRAVNPNNPSVTIGVKPRQDSVPPGSLVLLDVYIQEGNPDLLFKAADPNIRVQVSFDPQVLALVSGGRQLRTSSSTMAVVEVQTRWEKNRSIVLATIECRAVAGERVNTRAMVIGAQWGKPAAEILPFEQAVIVEEPEKPDTAVKFTTLVSRAGGTRLIGTAKRGTIAVIPNPASGDVKIGYTLAEAGDVEITLLTASGEVVQTLAKEWREAGEYSISADLRNVPSGAYRLVVRTRGRSIGEHLNIIR